MNARSVNALAGVIHAAMRTHQTAAGIAVAVEAAGLLMSPETAAELARLRAEQDEMVRVAVGDGMRLQAGPVDEIRNLRAKFNAQHARANTLDGLCRTLQARVAELESDAARLQAVADREHKAFIDTHNALNLLREDANRVMAEHGVQAQQAELERVRGQAAKFKRQRGERTKFLATVSAELERTKARVAELEQQPAATQGDLTIYWASHDSIVMGLYTTAAEARAHCVAEERRSRSTPCVFDWIEDEEDGVAELVVVAEDGDPEDITGYVVTALTVASAYDPDGDE